MRRFYAPGENFAGKTVGLSADETRHLRDVLRLKTGDDVSIFDGEGREFLCSISEIGKTSAVLSVSRETRPTSPESELKITLAATVLSGEKYDLIVQKAVELGVSILVPMGTIRCDVKTGDAAKRVERWRRIALEATKQSGRAKLMEIAQPTEFETLIAGLEPDSTVMFSERDGDDFQAIAAGTKMTALFGPKGGWDDSELAAARSAGFHVVTLGGRILRAETAAISITAILQHRFGDMN